MINLSSFIAYHARRMPDRCPRLASFKVPRELVIRDSLPRNPSGKVLINQPVDAGHRRFDVGRLRRVA
jgi:acyl-CoA synthetase (AMP-forming)/AMP-acid ligase II